MESWMKSHVCVPPFTKWYRHYLMCDTKLDLSAAMHSFMTQIWMWYCQFRFKKKGKAVPFHNLASYHETVWGVEVSFLCSVCLWHMSLKNLWCEYNFWVSLVMPKYGSSDKQIICSYHLIMQNIHYFRACLVWVWLMEFGYISFWWLYGEGSWKRCFCSFLLLFVMCCSKSKIFIIFFSMLLNMRNLFSGNTLLKTNIFVLGTCFQVGCYNI